MTKPLRIVMAGCGDIATTAHLPAIARTTAANLVAVVDQNVSRRDAAGSHYLVPSFGTLEEAAERCDAEAVIVATPPHISPQLCVAALRLGLHVLCEKPMAIDVASAQQLHAAAIGGDRIVQIGFTNRFSPLVQSLRRAIRAGRMGSPLTFALAAYDERYDPADRQHLERMMRFLRRAPAFVHEGAHLVDYVAYLTGAKPVRVSAAGSKSVAEFPSENFVAATVEWDNGDLARLEVAWLYPVLPVGHFRVLGPHATAEIFRRDGRLVLDDGVDKATETLERDWISESFDRQLAHYIASIRGTEAPGPTTADGLASLRLSDAIVLAMREHRTVELVGPTPADGTRSRVPA